MTASSQSTISRLHYLLIRGFLDRHACPTNAELAREFGAPSADDHLRALADVHGLVLHPHVCEPWVVHPFSVTPTPHWVEGTSGGWWAPCIWCAFGIATLAQGETRIHTRLAAESESLIIPVKDGIPTGHQDLYVHFAIPPAKAWQNVHEHCAMVLPFRSPEEIQGWCNRHRLPYGQAVPLLQTANFARLWYGGHAAPDWRKVTIAEAQAIFHQAGLDAPFFDLGTRTGGY